jgi:hypothetical protein
MANSKEEYGHAQPKKTEYEGALFEKHWSEMRA